MVGTFDYNKVPVIKHFSFFFFQQASRFLKIVRDLFNTDGTLYKDQQQFYQEIYTYLGNLLSVMPLIERPALKDKRKAF